VVWAVGLLRPYIEGTKFRIRCDHKALKWILTTTACTNNRLNRWRILLSEFDYDLGYKPGPQQAVADALSRLLTEGLDTGPIFQEIPTVGVTTRSGAVLDPRLPENMETARIPLSELSQKQADDEFCQEVEQLLDTSESTRFYQNADGLLFRERHRASSQPGVAKIPFYGPNGIRIRCVTPSPDKDKSHLSKSGSDYNLTKPDH